MPTNKEWLFSLPLEEQYAWMNAEHYGANPDCSPMVYQAYTGGMMVDAEQGSREKLEADIRKRFHAYGESPFCNEIFGWLDRQAAITEAKMFDHYQAELKRRDKRERELTVERDYWKELNEYHALQYDQACDDIDKLTAEREFYREQLGRILDLVDEMRYIAASVHSRDEGLA